MKQSILRDTCMLTGGDGKNYLLLFPDPPGIIMQVSLKKDFFYSMEISIFGFRFSVFGFRFPVSLDPLNVALRCV